jgi:hypothetical protein
MVTDEPEDRTYVLNASREFLSFGKNAGHL